MTSVVDPFYLCKYHSEGFNLYDFNISFKDFKNEILDDNVKLKTFHIDICEYLFSKIETCQDCVEPFSKTTILCRNCHSSNSSCETCKFLFYSAKQMKILKLFIKKFIINRYDENTVGYFIKRFKPESLKSFMLHILSEISYSYNEIVIIKEEFLKSNKSSDSLISNEIKVLNTCAKYHEKLENVDSMDLFKELLEKGEKYSNDYLYYLAMRFNLSFYKKITSKDLLSLIKSVIHHGFDPKNEEFSCFIKDLFIKIYLLNFLMDEKDFHELIDIFIENSDALNNLFCFFKKKEYFEMLTEEKLISLFMKIFKIKSIRSVFPFKNLRIFKNEEFPSNLNLDQNILPDDVEIFSKDISSLNTELMNFSATYLIYRENVISMLIEFSKFTPNGLVKIACIIFSLLNAGNEHIKDFKDLFEYFYGILEFNTVKIEQVLDIIDLHLFYNIPYDYVWSTIQPIFNNINNANEFELIFDHIFTNPNKSILLGIFAENNNTRLLSESKLTQLIEYSFDELSKGNNKLLIAFRNCGLINTDFQRKYINNLLNRPNCTNIDFIEYIEDEIVGISSKNIFSLLLELCLKHEKYKIILRFAEYLDFDQLKQIKDDQLGLINNIIFESAEGSDVNILKYIESPFFYKSLPYYIGVLVDIIKKEDFFYTNSVLSSILNNPLFQRCLNESNKENPNYFENEYMNSIIKEVMRFGEACSNICKIFYENFSSECQFAFKAKLLNSIIFERNIKIEHQLLFAEEKQTVENLLKECINIPSISKIDFFLNNFDSWYFYSSYQLPELFKIAVLSMDFDHLIEVYFKNMPRYYQH